MANSPAFSDFRNLMDIWDEALEKDRLHSLIHDDDDVCFFFVKDNKVFGGSEESRLTFARMKNPDAETDNGWAKEATFVGLDIDIAAKGKKQDGLKLFSFNDLKDVKVISQEDAEKMLKKEPK